MMGTAVADEAAAAKREAEGLEQPAGKRQRTEQDADPQDEVAEAAEMDEEGGAEEEGADEQAAEGDAEAAGDAAAAEEPTGPFKLGYKTFQSTTDLRNWCATLLKETPIGGRLNEVRGLSGGGPGAAAVEPQTCSALHAAAHSRLSITTAPALHPAARLRSTSWSHC